MPMSTLPLPLVVMGYPLTIGTIGRSSLGISKPGYFLPTSSSLYTSTTSISNRVSTLTIHRRRTYPLLLVQPEGVTILSSPPN